MEDTTDFDAVRLNRLLGDAFVVFADDEGDDPILLENMAALKRIAGSMGRRTATDRLDLFQEGVLELLRRGTMKGAIGAMKQFVRKEIAERLGRKELTIVHGQLKRSARMFEGLDDALKVLTERQRRITLAWLQNSSMSEIGRQEGIKHPSIRKVLVTAFTAIAAWCGKESINLEAVFPGTLRLLPRGVHFRGGKYLACASKCGRYIHLGSYDSLEQATEARRRPGDFVKSPLDVL